MKHTLQFNGIFDLLTKVEKIRLAHELVNKLYKQQLLDNGIPFTEIGDLGTMIDMSKVPKGKEEFVENPFNSIIKEVYSKTGISTT